MITTVARQQCMSSSRSASANALIDLLCKKTGDRESAVFELRWMVQRALQLTKFPHSSSRTYNATAPSLCHGLGTEEECRTPHLGEKCHGESLLGSSDVVAPSARQLPAALTALSSQAFQLVSKWAHARVAEHTPLQYLLESVPFGGLELRVRPPVLIPRWETEEWSARLLDEWRPFLQSCQGPAALSPEEGLRIVDLCSGSGAIGLHLAAGFREEVMHSRDAISVHGFDVHPTAVELATWNAGANGLQRLCTFDKLDLLVPENSAVIPACDLVVTNPPYIAEADHAALDPDVRLWEDKSALVGGRSGTEFYRPLAELARKLLLARRKQRKEACTARYLPKYCTVPADLPAFAAEIGHDQGAPVAKIVAENFIDVEVWKDLAGKDRCVVGRKVRL